jgi:hypothetical protein
MAGVVGHVNSGEVVFVAATAKTILQAKSATNQRSVIKAIRLTGKQPAGGTDTPVRLRMTRSTANFGTGSAATAGKNDPTDSETIQTVFAANFTVEPTSPTDSGLWWEVQPQSGLIEFYPTDLYIKIPGGQSAQFEVLSVATPTLVMEITFEE